MDPTPSYFPNSPLEFIFNNTSLGAYLDQKSMVMLLDGRILVGTIRSFDQHGNIVISDAFERIIVGHLYSDKPMGLLVQRSENIVLIGQMSQDSSLPELPPHMTKVSLPEILKAKNTEEGSLLLQRNLKKWIDEFLD